MRGLLQLPREQHDQSRHQQEYRDQAADDALGKDDAHIITQTELHQCQCDQAGDRRQGGGGDLEDRLGESLDQGLLDDRILRHLILIAVDKDDRIVDRQNQLQDDRDGIRDGGDLAQPVIRAHVHQGGYGKYDPEDHDLEVAPRCKQQHRNYNNRRDRKDADHLLGKLRRKVVPDLGRDVGIIVFQPLFDMIHLSFDLRIVGLPVKRDRQQCGRIDEMRRRVIKIDAGDVLIAGDLIRQLLCDVDGNV